MRGWSTRPPLSQEILPPEPEPHGHPPLAPYASWPAAEPAWDYRRTDAGITAGLLLATVLLCVPLALYLRADAAAMDRRREESAERTRRLSEELERAEAERAALVRLRREARAYLAEIEARPVIPWETVMTELSRCRPKGVWTTRISGDGPRFRAQLGTASETLAVAYARRLMESPYVDFAAVPGGEAALNGAQVVGRMRGE